MARKRKEVEAPEDLGLPSYETKEIVVVEGYSDAVAASDGKITCTVQHATLGPIPFTYCPNETDEISLQLGRLLKQDKVKHSKLPVCESVARWAAFDARAWRNSELKRSDVIINKIEDFEIEGDSKAWRQYRAALRNWPATTGFPSEESRPTAPDAQ